MTDMNSDNERIIIIIIAIVLLVVTIGIIYDGSSGGNSRGVYLDPKSGFLKVRIGVMADLTGPTRDIGKGYYKGVITALRYFNATGIETSDGRRVIVNIEVADHGYKPYLAEEYYMKFMEKGLLALIGYGTADSLYLSSKVQRDRILYISASYASSIASNPYIFYPAPDYSTQACTALAWAANHADGNKLAMVYDFDTAYGRDPIPAIIILSSSIGLELVGEVDINLEASETNIIEATRQLIDLDPDIIWCGGDLDSCASLIKALSSTCLDALFVVNVWGFSEQLPELAGPYSYGRTLGVSPFAYPSIARELQLPGWGVIEEAAMTLGIPVEDIDIRFIQGFINNWLLVQAIERTDSKQILEYGGEALKNALEDSCTGVPFTFGGLTAEVARFCPGYHGAFDTVFIISIGNDGSIMLAGTAEPPSGVSCKPAGG